MSAHSGGAEAGPAPGELSDYLLLTVGLGVRGDLGKTERPSLRIAFSPGSRDSWGLPVLLCALAMHGYMYNWISNFPGNTVNFSLFFFSSFLFSFFFFKLYSDYYSNTLSWKQNVTHRVKMICWIIFLSP